MRTKHRKTLADIRQMPTRSDVRWPDVKALIEAGGGTVEERRGSRVGMTLNGEDLVLHVPHPRPVLDKGRVVALRRFLVRAGLIDDEP